MNQPGTEQPFGTSQVAAMAICALLLAITLCYPYIIDNVPQEYIAARLLHGELPYVGTWDQNFPGTVFIHLVQQVLFGRSAVAFHLMDVLLQLVAVAFIFRLARTLVSPTAGLFAAVFYTLYYVLNGMDDLVGQKDVYATIAMLIGVYLLLTPQRWRIPVSGLLFGFAVLIRPTYGLHTIAAGLYLLASQASLGRWRNAFWRTLSFFIASAVPLGLFVGVYLLAGRLTEFYEAVFLFTTSVYNPKLHLGLFGDLQYYVGIPQLLGVVGCVAIWQGKTYRRAIVLLVLMLIMSVISLGLLWGYRYHAQPLFVAVLIMAGMGVGALLDFIGEHLPITAARYWSYAAVVVVIGFILFECRGTTQKRLIGELLSGDIHSRDEMLSTFTIDATFYPAKEEALGRYIQHHARQGDRMESFHSTVYPQFIADLQPANRFILTIPIVMRGPTGGLTPMQQRWKSEYIDSILTVRPRWFLVPDPSKREGIVEHGLLPRELLAQEFPAIQSLLSASYRIDTVIGEWTLYERK